MHELKVYLVEDALAELQDAFLDKEDDLRQIVYSKIRELAKQGRMIELNKQFMANKLDEDKKQITDAIKLKEFNLDEFELQSDPTWLPENLEKDDTASYVIKVGDKTFKSLQTYSKVYQARVDIYNKSLDKQDPNYNDIMAKPAECFEQIIQQSLIQTVQDEISKVIDKGLDAEFKEINEPPKKKEKPDRTGNKNKD